MVYGSSYEGRKRECEACGHYTNVHVACERCENACCEACQSGGFCGAMCRAAACEHSDMRLVGVYDDVDAAAGYAERIERYACSSCGEQFDGGDFPPPPAMRKPAAFAAASAVEMRRAS